MTLRNLALDLDDAVYQAALTRAQGQGKTLEHVLAELISAYTRGDIGGELTTYTVQRGDTLGTIARQVYGNAHQYPLIQQANNLSDPGRIWVGQVLVIPPQTLASQPPATPTPAPAPAVPSPQPQMVPPPPPPQPQTAPPPSPKPQVVPPQPQMAPPPPPPPTQAAPPPPQPQTVPPPPKPQAAPPPAPPKPQVDPCSPIPGEKYGTIPIVGSPADRPAAQHGDINLALRGFARCGAKAQLIDMSGPTDDRAPQLAGLFADKRTPAISNVYQVNQWDWGSNSRGKPITDFEVTAVGCQVKMGEPVYVPEAGYSIGQGFAVMVLYADQHRITLKYTGEDSVVHGYAVHVEGVCTEPSLLALYEQMNAAGRRQLPALRAGQAFGRARGAEIQVTIRDTGRFMDPRVRKDWWRGR